MMPLSFFIHSFTLRYFLYSKKEDIGRFFIDGDNKEKIPVNSINQQSILSNSFRIVLRHFVCLNIFKDKVSIDLIRRILLEITFPNA